MKLNKKILLIISFLLAITSCQEQWPYYHEYHSVDSNDWFTNDKVQLHVPALPHDTTLNLSLCLRNTQTYTYQYLNLCMSIKDDTTHQSLKTLTFKVPVYDDNGLAIGKGFPYLEAEYEIQGEKLKLKKGHTYTVSIWHNMHKPSINGITDIGIKLY